MTGARPGDGDPYRDPYGRDEPYEDPYRGADQYRADPYGADPYGADPYGVSGTTYGEDPYGTRQGHGAGHGAAGHGGEAYGYEPAREQSAWSPDPYGRPYERPGNDYRAAVDSLADPLTDPLPSAERGERGPQAADWSPGGAVADGGGSPWFRPTQQPQQQPQQHQQSQQQPHHQQTPHPQSTHPQSPRPPQQRHAPQQGQQPSHRAQPGPATPGTGRQARPAPRPADAGATVAMPAVEAPDTLPRPDRATGAPDSSAAAADRTEANDESHTVALRRPSAEELGGRAARRRAAGKGRGRRRTAPAEPPRPMTRLEARRAARAAKDGPVVLLSRAIGEVFITCGVLMLLFVAYQLWWTNVLAGNYAGGAKETLTQKWENNPEREPGKFSPGQGFAIMYIPKLDVVVPVAQGIDKETVLDKGLVGHYDKESGIPTAMPWDEKGNFGVAGHRNTHGEPFRYINRLVAGDKIIVETADTYYIYEMYSRLPSTSPSNVSVLEPVPPQSGFDEPGRYITLTTCTPEFTSKYRLIVWGRMVDERPRSEGKPDALVE